jgi:hypothetical protein
MKYKYKNPKYAQNGAIDCEIEHPKYGWIPFTAHPNDCEKYGKELYNKIKKEAKIAPYVPYIPTNEELAEQIRINRDELLKHSDWTQLTHVPDTIKQEWSTYRQMLRDITKQKGFPQKVVWPKEPV